MEGKKRGKVYMWTAEQLNQRRRQMEQIHPGYLAMNTRMNVYLGIVLILRFLYLGLLAVLGQGTTPLFGILNLVFCFAFYRAMLQSNWKIAWFFLIMRGIEVIQAMPQIPSIIYLNYLGIMIYVVLIITLVSDVSFLAYVAFSKKVHRMVEDNRFISSDQDLSMEEAGEGGGTENLEMAEETHRETHDEIDDGENGKYRMILLVLALLVALIFINGIASRNRKSASVPSAAAVADDETAPGEMDIKKMKLMVAALGVKHSKPVANMTLSEEAPGFTDSKVGGVPYLPADMEFPQTLDGRQLSLLAQINCEDLAGLEDFPATGILQFYILNDSMLGYEDDLQAQNHFRVIYHETVDASATEEMSKRKMDAPDDESYFPVAGSRKLEISVDFESMSIEDYRFMDAFMEEYNKIFPEYPISSLYDLPSEVLEVLYEKYSGQGHKMGGYPFFTQEDPRPGKGLEELDTLLFQLDSDQTNDEDNILWGDLGVGNFFIRLQDLKNMDFSKVAYTWDCY